MSVSMDVEGSRRSWLIIAALVAALVMVIPSGFAFAQETAATVSMEVEVGIAGYVDPTAPVSVRVDLTAQQLLVGRVDVRANRRTASVDVEVPAGSTKQYVVDLPALGRSRQVTIAVFRGEESLLNENVRVRVPGDEVIVAVAGLEGIESTLRSAVSTPIGREITPLRVELATAASSLSVAPYLVVGPGELAALDAATLREIESWVRRGGRVIGPVTETAALAAPPGKALPGAPVVAALLGAGEVLSVESVGELDADDWTAVLRDVAPKGLIYDQSQDAATASLLSAASAGREAAVPALNWLLAGILLFVVLVGPVNFLLLRWMGKPEWAWLTVPALSIVFVAGFWFIGRSQLNEFTVDQATVMVEEYDQVQASTALVMQVATEGTHELALPEGWKPEAFESLGLKTADSTSVDAGRSVLSFDMKDLGVGVAQASLDREPLDVDVVIAPSADNAFTATVTNNTDVEFWGWGVVLNGRANGSTDPLPPDASLEVRVLPRGISQQYEAVISTGLVRSFNSPTRDQNTYATVQALARHAETMAPGLRNPGAYFFGFTDALEPSVSVDGKSTEAVGTTLVVQRLELDPSLVAGVGRARPELISVTGASSLESWYGEIYAYGADAIVLGYKVPDGVPPVAKIATISRQFVVVEAYDWSLGEFAAIEWNADFSLPRFTSVTGDLIVRATVDPDRQGEFFGDESIVLDRYSLTWSTS